MRIGIKNNGVPSRIAASRSLRSALSFRTFQFTIPPTRPRLTYERNRPRNFNGRDDMPDIGLTSAQSDNMPPRKVSSGLNLWLELEDPGRMAELLAGLEAQTGAIQQVLRSLHYVHFSRFLPTPGWDSTPPPAVVALQVITEFDGDFDAYVLDFA